MMGYKTCSQGTDDLMILRLFQLTKGDISSTATVVGCSKKTVVAVQGRSTFSSPYIQKKRGPKNKLGPAHHHYIESQTQYNRHISAASLVAGLKTHFQIDVSIKTVNRARALLGYNFKPPLRSVYLTEAAKRTRISWCRQRIAENACWQSVIFSDESYFELQPSKRWLWRKPGEEGEDVRIATRAHPPKILIWGAIGHNFKSALVIVDGNITSKVYKEDILEGSGFIEDATRAFPGGFVLQQDNARPHVSLDTRLFLAQRGVKVLDKWPPYSPDLNIIELVWAIMKRRIEILQPKTQGDLQIALHQVWDELSYETIEKLIDSIPARLQYVANHQGLTVVGHL